MNAPCAETGIENTEGGVKAIIVGAGIGGLTTALFFHKHGIGCDVFESAPAIQELGVGINLLSSQHSADGSYHPSSAITLHRGLTICI